jgi:DNA polymerase
MDTIREDLMDVLKSVDAYIELQRLSGVERYLKPDGRPSAAGSKDEVLVKKTLEALEIEALSCAGCQLSKTRNNVVYGSGSSNAKLMFIGEGPGYDEDMQGLPFVGRAGKLLTKIIEAMGLKRKDVYIANIVKCRPPQNRNPLPTEVLACESHLLNQIEAIRPQVICALGKVAAQTLLKSMEPISRMRGRFFVYHDVKLMPTYHPAYLLRNPSDKKLVWQDMKKIMAELGIKAK